MARALIAIELGRGHVGGRLLSQFVVALLAILLCSSAEADFFNALMGGSDYKVGQVLTVEVKKFDRPGLVKSTFNLYNNFDLFDSQENVKVSDPNWDGNKYKMIVQGFPADRISWKDYTSSVNFTVKVAELRGQADYPSTRTMYFVTATFDKFDPATERDVAELEKKIKVRQAEKDAEAEAKRIAIEKCRFDFDAIPEEGGSIVRLDELATRCKNYVSTISMYCNAYGGAACSDVNANDVSAKWERILVLRQKQLVAGTQKIQDFRDANLLHQPETLESIMSSPLLKPDKKIYGNKLYALTLDAQEKNDLIRGKISADDGSFYIYLRTNAKTTVFHPDKLRIGATISVIGRYVSNATYTTLVGAKKMAPVLEVLFIE